MDKTRIVVPGELISNRPEKINYAFVENGKTYSSIVALYQEGKLIPLEGPYEPAINDIVIGVIVEVKFGGYSVEINTPFLAYLSSKDFKKFEMGDTILARVSFVDEVNSVELSDARKLPPGRLIKISPVKVPRVIGKKNSMIEMLKAQTGCDIYVGKNGYVLISGKGKPMLAEKAIRLIELQAHTPGLTDRIASFLKKW
jgi:exosome complex component RRP4